MRAYESIAAHRQNKNRDWELAHKSRFLRLAWCSERPPVPFFRLNVGTGDRNKLLCTLLPPQRGHRRQEQASLCPSSASAWAQEIGTSWSVPFFRHGVGTGDRNKLVCALLPPQRGHRRQEQASLCPSSASAWAQETGTSSSVPLNQGTGRYTQNLMIKPRVI